MIRSRYVLTFLFVLSSLFASSQAIAGQTSTTSTSFTSELTGAVIDIGTSGEAEFQFDLHLVTDEMGYYEEQVWIYLGSSTIHIGFIEEGVTPQDWSETNLSFNAQDFTNVESLYQQFEDTHSAELTRYDFELNIKEYAYIEYQVDAFNGFALDISVFGSESSIVSDVEWVQNNITIDDQPVLQNADTTTIQAAIDGTLALEPIPVLSDLTLADWEAAGVVSDAEFESQVTGTSVTWDTASWQFDSGLAWSVGSFEDSGENDHIYLFTPGYEGQFRVAFYEDNQNRTIEDWVARWESASYQNDNGLTTIDSRIAGTVGGVIFTSEHLYGDTLVLVRISYINANGEFVMMDILASDANIESVYDAALTAIEVDGGEIHQLWTPSEVAEVASGS